MKSPFFPRPSPEQVSRFLDLPMGLISILMVLIAIIQLGGEVVAFVLMLDAIGVFSYVTSSVASALIQGERTRDAAASAPAPEIQATTSIPGLTPEEIATLRVILRKIEQAAPDPRRPPEPPPRPRPTTRATSERRAEGPGAGARGRLGCLDREGRPFAPFRALRRPDAPASPR